MPWFQYFPIGARGVPYLHIYPQVVGEKGISEHDFFFGGGGHLKKGKSESKRKKEEI
jgi:hypothetical protein